MSGYLFLSAVVCIIRLESEVDGLLQRRRTRAVASSRNELRFGSSLPPSWTCRRKSGSFPSQREAPAGRKLAAPRRKKSFTPPREQSVYFPRAYYYCWNRLSASNCVCASPESAAWQTVTFPIAFSTWLMETCNVSATAECALAKAPQQCQQYGHPPTAPLGSKERSE